MFPNNGAFTGTGVRVSTITLFRDTIKPTTVRKALSLGRCLMSVQSILAFIMTSEVSKETAHRVPLGRAGAGRGYLRFINRRCFQTEADILREENGDK